MEADLYNLSDNSHAIEDSISDELCKALKKLDRSDSMEVDEFLSIVLFTKYPMTIRYR